MGKLASIKERPTVIDNNHESLYRSYHILDYVLKLVERDDSKDTIFEVVDYLRAKNVERETVRPIRDTDFVAKASIKHNGIKKPI
jgi:hypothetical protein